MCLIAKRCPLAPFQVLELGALVEALEPVPGLDPNAFLSVLHCGGDTDRGKDLDYRDVKIIQLAKRIRDRDAKLDKERTRWVGLASWFIEVSLYPHTERDWTPIR